MRRDVDLAQISDGRLYTGNDMARTDCRGCEGCDECCRGMGDTVILDPMDVWRLHRGAGKDFAALMTGRYIELGVADGMILPHLNMSGSGEACAFLDGQGRCSVHACRPGICRMFPMGRYYSESGIRYILQIHECRKKDRGKMKVRKWIGIPDLPSYEAYILSWHDFLDACRSGLAELDDAGRSTLALYVLRVFYEQGFPGGKDSDFYSEFTVRLDAAKAKLGF